MLLSDTAAAEEKQNISKVTFNNVVLTEVSEGVYSGTVSGGSTLNLSIYSDFEKLTDYNLKASITFSYPYTVGTYLNTTPFKHTYQHGVSYLGEIGNISVRGTKLAYHTSTWFSENQPNVPPFTHGGYLSTPFGGSSSTQTFDTELTYYFGEEEGTDYIGLLFQTGSPGKLGSFGTTKREVTIQIDYLTPVERATIENAETTKNIFEWLQDGFVNLIVPTSDGLDSMLDETANTLESRLGILYMPIEFTGQLLGTLSSSLDNAGSSQSISVPEWTMSIFGRTYKLWNQTSFSITDNAIFRHIISNNTSVLLLRILYIVALFNAIFKTIDVLSDGMYDDEFVELVNDNGEEEKV